MNQNPNVPTCCGAPARWIDNGMYLKYWYCDECKQEPKDPPKSLAVANEIALEEFENFMNWDKPSNESKIFDDDKFILDSRSHFEQAKNKALTELQLLTDIYGEPYYITAAKTNEYKYKAGEDIKVGDVVIVHPVTGHLMRYRG